MGRLKVKGGIRMGKKVIEDLKMGNIMCSSYLAAAAGILRKRGFWEGENYLLAGMTGMVFHFIIHKKACPSSITVYDWLQEHFIMLDRVGINSDVFNFFNDGTLNTFDLVQADAIERIKESINQGMGVVAWAPTPLLEFGIIKGYDDFDGVFFVDDFSCGQEPDPLMYTNLGKSEVPFLFYQIFKDKIDVPLDKVIRSSLAFGVSEWEKEFHINPQYASGRKGYDYLISTMQKGDYDSFGLSYIFFSYADAKQSISKYLEYIMTAAVGIKGLCEVNELYRQVASNYTRVSDMVNFQGPGSKVNKEKIPMLLALVKEAKEFEEEAMKIIKDSLNI